MSKKAKSPRSSADQFVFRQTDTVGTADAADDEYLAACFTDTGALECIEALGKPHRLVVGRTGSGKTALLQELERRKPGHCIAIRAESLALAHVSNSTILRFLQDLGVKLDIFFRMLWRHVFAVEVLKRRFKINDEGQRRSFFERVADVFKSKEQRQAIEYLRQWGGDSFWEQTDYRIREITKKLEIEVSKTFTPEISSRLKGAYAKVDRFSTEEKGEIVARAQKVVNEVQIRELSYLIDLIAAVLDDADDYYYVLLDRLDEAWVDDSVRYLLIRALLETAKDFQKVRRCKIVIALRYDLLQRVFDQTRDAGFQEEKFTSLILELPWTDKLLEEMIDRRINELVKRRYTKEGVSHKDIMASRVNGELPVEFLIDRTLRRPRDLIHFVNLCLKEADGAAMVTAAAIKRAEARYSTDRLRFLRDEWFADYPDLLHWAEVLRGMPPVFPLNAISASACDDVILHCVSHSGPNTLSANARQFYEHAISPADFIVRQVLTFYEVGLVGIKTSAQDATQWLFRGGRTLTASADSSHWKVHVHKLAWRHLAIAYDHSVA